MTNNTDTLVAFAATSGATRFWTGTDAAGKLAQFWTKQPNAAGYPGLRIESHIILHVVDGKEAAALATSSAPAEPCDQCNGRGYLVSDGEYDGKCHCGAHFMDKTPAAPAPAAPVPESQVADERDRFETWLRAVGRLHESDLGHGKVFLDAQKAEVLWQAFQAGAALSAPAAAPVPAASEGWTEKLRQLVLDVCNASYFTGRQIEEDETYAKLSKNADAASERLLDFMLASVAEPVLTITGRMCEVGNLESGDRGFSLEIDGENTDLTGLTEEETRAVAALYGRDVTITVLPAAPATSDKAEG